MGSFADYLENELLDHVFGAASYTPPVTLYLPQASGSWGTVTTSGGNTLVHVGQLQILVEP